MTDAPPAPGHSSGPLHSGPACGNCGRAVAATDVICPMCDVLLAAYQAPAGASPLSAAIQPVSTPVPPSPQPPAPDRSTSTNPATATSGPGTRSSSPDPSPLFPSSSPPLHQPQTMSPIGDALDRVDERGSSIGSDVEIPSSDDVAVELSKMAENDSELAKDVDARLRGAKVRFDGAAPTIEAQPDPEPEPVVPAAGPRQDEGAAAPRTLAPVPSLPGAVRPARSGDRRMPATSGPARSVATPPASDSVHPVATRDVSGDAPREAVLVETAAPAGRRRHPYAGKVVRAIPFVLIVLFLVLGFDRPVSIISGGIIIGLGVLIVTGLVFATSRVGRKTTSMVRDDHTRMSQKRRSM